MNYRPDPNHPLTVAYPWFPPEEQQWLERELREILNGMLSMGPRVKNFEAEFAAFCGVPYAVALPSCTSALQISMLALGIEPGDEVLVPPQTFVATGAAVVNVGATPVFTEIDASTFSMDFEDAWSRVSERTRGAIVVHFGGLIDPRVVRFAEAMRASGRFVIEDCAHAHGATLGGRFAGTIGDTGCFSFYPTKIMTTGEGGMLVTSDERVFQVARSLQNRGRDMSSRVEVYERVGANNRFTEIAAAMGLSQLRCLPQFLAARRRVASIYDELFLKDDLLQTLTRAEDVDPSYWRYVLVPREPIDRVTLRARLAEEQITIDWAYEPPLHLQPAFRSLLGTAPGMLPRSEDLMARHICLPMHARLRDEDARFVGERVRYHVSALAAAAVR